MTVIKSSILLITLLTLSACGGGGDSSNPSNDSGNSGNNTPLPATLQLASEQIPISFQELEYAELTFNLQGVEGTLDVTVEHDYLPEGALIETLINDSMVTLKVFIGNEEMHNQVSTVKVTIEDHRSTTNQSVIWEGAIPILNVSGDAEYERLNAIGQAAQAYAELSEEQKLVERLAQLAQLVDASTPINQQLELINRIKQVISNDEYSALLGEANSMLDKHSQQYLNGEISETKLSEVTQSFDTAIAEYSHAAHLVIQEAIAATNGEVTEYEYQGAHLTKSNLKFSSFIGNQSLGEYQDDKWVFNSKYILLEPIATPELETCNAE
ncbi:hypothetical protein [Colwellia sp. RSH04]|uniref:hypothetical protein n=1 Tax=Colwellia sp. RSH04 TaxID=2305464 RepID=UPI000E58E0CF|nr:hypothetical protein [Colwellia sp. RSH04]RHW76471.1 hypothetical protein D1094_09175 [Colwellia sp. RSH04]